MYQCLNLFDLIFLIFDLILGCSQVVMRLIGASAGEVEASEM